MSIFPRRVTPGHCVTFHVRYPGPVEQRGPIPESAEFPLLQASYRSPKGEQRMLSRWQPCALPPRPPSEEAEAESVAPGIRQRAPLLMIADRLAHPQERSSGELVDLLTGIHTSTHFYHHIDIPEDAPLGRWETFLEIWRDGHCREKRNEFWVESLVLENVEARGRTLEITVRNPSRDATPARIVPLRPDGIPGPHLGITVPAGGTERVVLMATKGFLSYAQGTAYVPLGNPGDGFCLRNQTIPWISNLEEGYVSLFDVPGEQNEEGARLDGDAFRIWMCADGTRLRSEIRSAQSAVAYDAMLTRGWIREVSCNREPPPPSL